MGKVNYMMTAQDVADALGCSVGKAYKVIYEHGQKISIICL